MIHFQWIVRSALATAGVLLASAQTAQKPETGALTPEPDHAVRDTRSTGAQAFRIASAILNETRRVYVVLPASFGQSAPERRYPVTIVLDGEASLPPVTAASHELARNGQIPESIVVAIPNTDPMRGRLRDLTPPGISVSGSSLNERGDLFLDFIEKELLPAVDRQFRGAAPRTFIGHSSGGILVTYAAATRPAFRAFVSIDAPVHLQENWLAEKLIARAKAPGAPLRYVSLEARFGWPEDAWKELQAAAPASWRLYRERMWPKESHESMPLISMYLGLREAFGDYSMLAAPTAPTTSILPYYSKVSESLGATVLPPSKLLRNVVEDLLMEGRGAAARDAYNQLASGYGAPGNSVALLKEIAEVERQPPPAETVEGLLAAPFATPAEAKPFLGEWSGHEWMTQENWRSDEARLRIWIENGRVKGETRWINAKGELLLKTDWQHLRVTPKGFTWGYMNGMRPRGMILYEAELRDGQLAGESRFGGINFRRPDGSPVPKRYFLFKRLQKAE